MAATALVVSAASWSEAATLSIVNTVRYNSAPVPGNNLTTQGNVDWAYWAASTGSGVSYGTNMVPTNDKSGGTAISNISVVGTGNFRGSDTADAVGSYSWSDGSSLTATTGNNQNLAGGLIFTSALNTPGAGFSLTVTGAVAGQTYYVMLYVGGFSATGNLSLSLPGIASPVTDSTQVFSGTSPKSIVGYQIAFTPDTAGAQLSISYTASNTGTNGHIGIEAVAVSTSLITPTPGIPEPSVALLGGIGAIIGLRRRRAC